VSLIVLRVVLANSASSTANAGYAIIARMAASVSWIKKYFTKNMYIHTFENDSRGNIEAITACNEIKVEFDIKLKHN
jgi:hypothetical protein